MIGGEIKAQTHLNSAEFEITMDASSYEYASIWHGFSLFHVQSCSTIPQEHESTNRMCFCLKKLQKKLREKF
jgi:hypothetical protein